MLLFGLGYSSWMFFESARLVPLSPFDFAALPWNLALAIMSIVTAKSEPPRYRNSDAGIGKPDGWM